MRSIDCGLAIADCGLDARPSNPQSTIRNPQLFARTLVLALLPSVARAQQPDSLPTDTLSPVVVTGVRLPTARELARGLAGRTATLHAADLDARGVRSLADALEQLPGVTTSDAHEDGWRAAAPSRTATLCGKLGVNTGTWDATLSYAGADNRIFQAGSLPDSVYAAAPRVNFTPGDYFAPQAHLVTLNAHRVLGGMQLAVNGFGRALTTDQFNRNASPPDTRERNRERIGGGAVQLSGTVALAGRPLRWLAGMDGAYQHTAVRLYAARSTAPDSLTESVLTNEVDLGAFVGANWPLAPALTATVAGRYDYIRVPFEDLLDPGQSGLNIFRRLSPRVGLTWSTRSGHELFWSVSRGFRAPALVEIGCADPAAACPLPFALGPDPALRPVIATTYESGWHFRGPGGHVDLSADAFWTDVSDDIFFVASNLTAGYFQNIGATRRAGIELAGQWESGGVRLYANYGYTAATFRSAARLATPRDPAGETVVPGDVLPLVPDSRANAGIQAPVVAGGTTGRSLRVGVDARYVGCQWLRGDEANTTRRLPDYAAADASLLLEWQRFELRCMVRNVFDRRYASFGTFAANPLAPGSPVQRFLTPGLPRHVQVSVSAEF